MADITSNGAGVANATDTMGVLQPTPRRRKDDGPSMTPAALKERLDHRLMQAIGILRTCIKADCTESDALWGAQSLLESAVQALHDNEYVFKERHSTNVQ